MSPVFSDYITNGGKAKYVTALTKSVHKNFKFKFCW